MDIIFPEGSEKFREQQADIVEYRNPTIFPRIKKYLVSLSPHNVLELGCGLGRMSVFLKNYFNWIKTKFYLYDGDSEQELISDPWGGKNDHIVKGSFHNNLKLTKEFCLLNGIQEKQIVLINAEEEFLNLLEVKFDLICSFLAIGYHWPIISYLDIIYQLINQNGIIIFETSHGDDIEDIKYVEKQVESINLDRFEILEASKPLIVIRKRYLDAVKEMNVETDSFLYVPSS